MTSLHFPFLLLSPSLAMFDMRLVLAAVVRNLDVHLAKETTPESMAFTGLFISTPKSGKLMLHFTKRSE